jgi:hypothetical protein
MLGSVCYTIHGFPYGQAIARFVHGRYTTLDDIVEYIGVANISIFYKLEEFDYVKGGHVGAEFPAKNFNLCNSMVACLRPPCDGIPAPWL